MEQKSVHRLVYKIETKMLKRAKWSLKLPLKDAMRNCPEVIVALNDSQCLRFIDDINGEDDINDKVRCIQRKIRTIKKKPKNPNNKMLISQYYDAMYGYQFQKDYICVVMNSNADYDRANIGFSIDYGDINGKPCVVNYRRLLGTNGGIKNSTIVFVNEKIYPELKRKLDNGRDMTKKLVPAKLEAYQALICSGSTPLPPPKGFIVVSDCITHFKEDVILIDDSGGDEPKLTYEKDYEIEHVDSDGFGLMTPAYARVVNEFLNGDAAREISGMNTRYAWEKGVVYTFDFVDFAEREAGSYMVIDAWGEPRDVRDADVILTTSMLKLWDCYQSWEDYYENCVKNRYQFCVTKTTPEELECVRDTNYQFLQDYELTDDELYALCKPTIDEIKDVLGLDYRKSLAFLCGSGLNDDNVLRRSGDDGQDYLRALLIDKRMINDPYVRRRIYNQIRNRIVMAERGIIHVHGNYQMISGDPYALAQHFFGLPVTGLLKSGEVYSRYWIDANADEVVCFRAPMTCRNNIRKMRLNKSDKAAYWYQYIKSALIYNAFDTSCEAMNGADKDGDTNMITDNEILIRNTHNDPTIICAQKSAEKIIPTEDDIIKANKLAFNDDIGTVTNRITSMIEVRAGFDKESDEYRKLSYRIMCGQKYQQDTIDRAKGIISNPMPEYWYSLRDCIVRDEDDDETIRRKEFNYRIAAYRKPYFMTYVYPKLRTEYNKYIRNNKKSVIRRFGDLGVQSPDDLADIQNKTFEMAEFYDYYLRQMPVGDNACVVNRISVLFENEFNGALGKIAKAINVEGFDYSIMKSGTVYSKTDYKRIKELHQEYCQRVIQLERRKKTERIDEFDCFLKHQLISEWFRSECFKICTNENELCDIILDICYRTEGTKQFAWDICGEVIVNNLLAKNQNTITYPATVETDGDFVFAGNHFQMNTVIIGKENVI